MSARCVESTESDSRPRGGESHWKVSDPTQPDILTIPQRRPVKPVYIRKLVRFVQEVSSRRDPVIVCGDFNAGPDSDEIRMLTGRAATAGPGIVFYDSWEMAGDGSPGYTWSNSNPLAAIGLYPNRRFDYIFSAWPRRHGVGHPVRCSLLGVRPPDQDQISDHYGLVAELRY